VLSARPAMPRDKAKVESGVDVVELWILAALRHELFYSLGELNARVATLLAKLNDRPFKQRPALRPQPG